MARIALSAIVISCYPLAFNSFRGSVAALLPAPWQEMLAPPASRKSGSSAAEGRRKHKVSDADEEEEEDADLFEGEGLDCNLLSGNNNSGTKLSGSEDDEEEEEGGSGGAHSGARKRGSGATAACCSPKSLLRALRLDWPHALLTLILVTTSLVIAICIPQVEVVLGYKGALGGSLIVYVFPAVMLYSLTQQQRLGRLGGGKASSSPQAVDEEEAATASEDRPFASGAAAMPSSGKASSAPGGVWLPSDVLRSWQGGLLLGFTALGLLIMVTGTLSTAGVISV